MSPTIASLLEWASWWPGEEWSMFQIVCCIATAACLAPALNNLLCMLERPVKFHQRQPHFYPREPFEECEIEFPWKVSNEVTTGQEESWLRIFGSWLKTCGSDWISFFDFAARRQKKWDYKRKEWRELQQQLSILRGVRARKIALQQEAVGRNPQASGQFGIKLSRGTTCPWKSNTSTSLFGNLKALLQDLYDCSWAQWTIEPGYRRKLKWDEERRMWRELQQQLGTLRAVRAKRKAADTLPRSHMDDIKAVDTNRSFPWKEETSTNCGLLELFCSWFPPFRFVHSDWVRWILEPEHRRTVKWDDERKRWRDLQQQLGAFRVIRAERKAAGTLPKSQMDDIMAIDTSRNFPWQKEIR